MTYGSNRYMSGRDDYLERTWGRDLRVDYREYSSFAIAGKNAEPPKE